MIANIGFYYHQTRWTQIWISFSVEHEMWTEGKNRLWCWFPSSVHLVWKLIRALYWLWERGTSPGWCYGFWWDEVQLPRLVTILTPLGMFGNNKLFDKVPAVKRSATLFCPAAAASNWWCGEQKSSLRNVSKARIWWRWSRSGRCTDYGPVCISDRPGLLTRIKTLKTINKMQSVVCAAAYQTAGGTTP